MMNYVWIFIGGGLGSICRYALSSRTAMLKLDFPLGTFLANVLASLLLGYLLGLGLKHYLPAPVRFLMITGFCGGFSTFSTFSSETYQLWTQTTPLLAIFNILVNVLVCLLAIYLGLRWSGGLQMQ